MSEISRRLFLHRAAAAAPAVALATGAGATLASAQIPDARLLALEALQIAAVPAAHEAEEMTNMRLAEQEEACRLDPSLPHWWEAFSPALDEASAASEAAWDHLTEVQVSIIELGPQTLAGVIVHARVVREECARWWKEAESAQDWDRKVARWFVDRILALTGEPEYALPLQMKLSRPSHSERVPVGQEWSGEDAS